MRVLLDENLPHDLAALSFGVVVIIARANRVQDLLPLVSAVLIALAGLKPGNVIRVDTGRREGVL